jgi:hypothetical protein
MEYRAGMKIGMKALHFTLRNRKMVAGAAMTIGALAGRALYDIAKNIRR